MKQKIAKTLILVTTTLLLAHQTLSAATSNPAIAPLNPTIKPVDSMEKIKKYILPDGYLNPEEFTVDTDHSHDYIFIKLHMFNKEGMDYKEKKAVLNKLFLASKDGLVRIEMDRSSKRNKQNASLKDKKISDMMVYQLVPNDFYFELGELVVFAEKENFDTFRARVGIKMDKFEKRSKAEIEALQAQIKLTQGTKKKAQPPKSGEAGGSWFSGVFGGKKADAKSGAATKKKKKRRRGGFSRYFPGSFATFWDKGEYDLHPEMIFDEEYSYENNYAQESQNRPKSIIPYNRRVHFAETKPNPSASTSAPKPSTKPAEADKTAKPAPSASPSLSPSSKPAPAPSSSDKKTTPPASTKDIKTDPAKPKPAPKKERPPELTEKNSKSKVISANYELPDSWMKYIKILSLT